MISKCSAFVILLGILNFGWSQERPDSDLRQHPFVPGQLILVPETGAQEAFEATLRERQIVVIKRDRNSNAVLARVTAGREVEACRSLIARPEIAMADLNYLGRGASVPNDTYYSDLWHLDNSTTDGADISAQLAWEITTGSTDTVIAVLDTGIDTDHPEFAGRIDPDGFDFVNSDNDPEADHPHGSWCSGLIAANANNGFGTVGVDWNCRILPVKVLNSFNMGTLFNLIQGLNFAAGESDVQVISMSLVDFPGTASLLAALDNARASGKILIACAGNGGPGDADVSYPGAASTTISVGTTDIHDERPLFSGTGIALDFVAPGASVTTIRFDSFADETTTVSGCSFATPVAAGIVGLLLARADEVGLMLTPAMVEELLEAGAEDEIAADDSPGPDLSYGRGRVNAFRSLLALASIAFDRCEDASLNPVVVGDNPYSNSLASDDGSFGCPQFVGGPSSDDVVHRGIWASFTAQSSGLYRFEACGFDTRMALFEESCPAGDSTLLGGGLACAEGGACGTDPSASIEVTLAAGQTIFVLVGGSDDAAIGFGNLEITFLAPSPSFRRGFVNSDSAIDLADAVAILNFLFLAQGIDCEAAGDVNDDNAINLADAVAILDYLFASSFSIPEPFAACGPDPIPDLDCAQGACP